MSINSPESLMTNNHSVLRSHQVSPLPIGSGGNNLIKQQMNQTNSQLTMLMAQASANTKYDPPVPKPITKPLYIEKFGTPSNTPLLMSVIGCILIVFSIVAK
jgi:hypothetical protein